MTREDAIEIIRKNMPSDKSLPVYEALQTLVPELDEKIREEMIRYFTEMKKGGSAAPPYDDCIAYLEKQKKQKPADEAEKFFDSVESYNQGFVAGQKKMKEDIEKGFGISEHSLDYLAGRYAGYAAARQEQEPAKWSDEDGQWLESIIKDHEDSLTKDKDHAAVIKIKIDFLKSLRPQLKKELSIEKAIQWLDDTFYFLDNSSGRGRDCEITTHDFDSLEEMYDSFRKAVIIDSEPHWKPSKEQMKAIKHAYNSFPNDCPTKENLRLLYHDLEKLM